MVLDDSVPIDDFDSWEEMWSLLQDDWVRIDDDEQRLRLERDGDELLLVEIDRRLRARQRRQLYRLGFRPVTALRVTVWQWDVQNALQRVERQDFCTPIEKTFGSCDPGGCPAEIEQLRTRLAKAHLLKKQTQRVVQEVFRSRLQNLSATLVQDESRHENWDGDEDWQLPAG